MLGEIAMLEHRARPLLSAKQAIPPRGPAWLRGTGSASDCWTRPPRRSPWSWRRLAGARRPCSRNGRAPAESRRVVWVTLDGSDDDPVRFWTYVLTALSADESRLDPEGEFAYLEFNIDQIIYNTGTVPIGSQAW